MILNIYKPLNWTSFDIVAKLRGILKTKKIGHAGTLDPLADGVLVILTEKDTKKQNELMGTKKEYIAEIALGLKSDSYDLETTLSINEDYKEVDIGDKYLSTFVKEFEQTVPPYSAVKVKGQRLYKLARTGEVDKVDLPVKKVTIYGLELLDTYKKDFTNYTGNCLITEDNKNIFKDIKVIKVKITCSSGFYVRSFAHDLGGVLFSLTRTKVGEYSIEDSVTIEDLIKKD